MFMFDVRVKTSSHKNKPSNENTDQQKSPSSKEKYYVSILLHCHYVWYVGRLNLCRVENVQLLLPKKKQLPRPCLCTPSGPSLAAEILSTDSLGFKMMRNDMHFQPLVLPQTVSNMARDFIASFNGQVS